MLDPAVRVGAGIIDRVYEIMSNNRKAVLVQGTSWGDGGVALSYEIDDVGRTVQWTIMLIDKPTVHDEVLVDRFAYGTETEARLAYQKMLEERTVRIAKWALHAE